MSCHALNGWNAYRPRQFRHPSSNGTLIPAQRAGHIASARATLLELRAAGLWLADEVISRALRLAGIETSRNQ